MTGPFPAPDAPRARMLAQIALVGAALHLGVSLVEVAQPATSSAGETLTFLRSGQARLEFLGFGIGDLLMSASLLAWVAAGLVGTRAWVRVAAWAGVAGFLAFAAYHFMIAGGRDPGTMPGFALAGMFVSQVFVPLAFAVAAFIHRRPAAGAVALVLALSPMVIFAALPQFVATAVHAVIWAGFAFTALRAAPAPARYAATVAAA